MPALSRRSPCARRARLPRAVLVVVMSLYVACSSGLSRPPTGEIPPDAFVEVVPYPPPVARVETVPPREDERDVWIDGQWAWNGKTWRWLPGAWVKPPAGAYFTPSAVRRAADGQLYFAPATWRAADGRPLGFGVEVCAPPGS